jgi:hypothetical protein
MIVVATEIPAFAGGITVVIVSQSESRTSKPSLLLAVVVQ